MVFFGRQRSSLARIFSKVHSDQHVSGRERSATTGKAGEVED